MASAADKIKTAVAVDDWVKSQAQPAPPRQFLIVRLDVESEAKKAFMVQFVRLQKAKISSRHAANMYRAVCKAELAKNLALRLPRAISQHASVQDLLSALQLTVFSAANWAMRFADERHKHDGSYLAVREKKLGTELTHNILSQVDALFDRIKSRSANSKREIEAIVNTFENQWEKEDQAKKAQAMQQNKKLMGKLRKAFEHAKAADKSKLAEREVFKIEELCAEVEESMAALEDDDQKYVEEVKAWHNANFPEVEHPWATQGITQLGPFGIHGNIKLELTVSYPEGQDATKALGQYQVLGPADKIADYAAALGGMVVGKVSPLAKITIDFNDPVRKLARIPLQTTHFAFAYPVINDAMDFTIQPGKRSPVDAFLLYGGFMYFVLDNDDKPVLRQTNGLWVGCQLLMSSPRALPPVVFEKLRDEGRFHDITLPQLKEKKARQFAWANPDEFPELNAPHGAYCYWYDDGEVNNYYAVASHDSILGVVAAFTIKD